MGNKFYVYEHWRPDRDECFYVGKGTGKRANAMRGRNKHHKAIQGKLARLGMCVEVRIVAHGLSEEDAFSIEKERIAFWRSMNIDLANATIGGEGAAGFVMPDEIRAQISRSLKGRKRPPEVVEKICAGLRGRVLSQEGRLKISKAHKGRKRSKEAIEASAAPRRGKPHSPEHRAAISAAAKKRFQDPVVKEQFRLHSVGRRPSEESRLKMSIAAKNRRRRHNMADEGKIVIQPADGEQQ